MRLTYVIVLACSMSVMGCITTSPKDMRSSPPVAEFSSENNAKIVATCIADGWENIDNYLMKVQMRPTTNGYSVWVEQSVGMGLTAVKDSATFLADIDDTSNGSVTRYYSVATSKTEWKDALRKCLSNAPAKPVAMPERTILDTPSNGSTSQKLRELQTLKNDGLINDQEFQKKKQQLPEKL